MGLASFFFWGGGTEHRRMRWGSWNLPSICEVAIFGQKSNIRAKPLDFRESIQAKHLSPNTIPYAYVNEVILLKALLVLVDKKDPN